MIKPFSTPIVTSLVIAYLAHPLYHWINKRINNRALCAFIVSTLILALIILPVIFMTNSVSVEARYTYLRTRQLVAGGNLFVVPCTEGALCGAFNWVGTAVLGDPQITKLLRDGVDKISTEVVARTDGIIAALPHLLLNLFIFVFLIYYFFRDGESLVKKLRNVFPTQAKRSEDIFVKLSNVVYAVVYGSVIIAFMQGITTTIGFYAFGVSSPILWGAVVTILAFIPLLGASIVWIPTGFLLILNGYVTGDYGSSVKGLLLLLYGFVVISGIEHILKPKLISSRGGVHPITVLLGVFGGVVLLGPIGFVVGPVILALFVAILEDPKTKEVLGL